MDDEPIRSQAARAAAELALVRVVHHYGDRPEFVVLGGLVPQLLCSDAGVAHVGTTDIDVQVDLEIAGGVVNTGRLEQALRNAEFVPDRERVWRWTTVAGGVGAVVKFELLADLETEPNGATVIFDDCEQLGAANLRGTGFAARDVEVRRISAKDGGVWSNVEVNVTGLAGFLLAKVAAAHGRRKAKDGTTSPSSSCTTTRAVRKRRSNWCSTHSARISAVSQLPYWTWPRTSPILARKGQPPTPSSSASTTPMKIPQHSRQTHWLPSRRSARHCFGISRLLDVDAFIDGRGPLVAALRRADYDGGRAHGGTRGGAAGSKRCGVGWTGSHGRHSMQPLSLRRRRTCRCRRTATR